MKLQGHNSSHIKYIELQALDEIIRLQAPGQEDEL